jgi:hypothetical protein
MISNYLLLLDRIMNLLDLITLNFVIRPYLIPLARIQTTPYYYKSYKLYIPIGSWTELEEREKQSNEARLFHLTSVCRWCDKSIFGFVKRFTDIKDRCFHLMILEGI